MPDGVTTHSSAAEAGAAGMESAGGAAVPPGALLSATFVLLSAVQAPRMMTASVNGEMVGTMELSVGTVQAVARTVPEVSCRSDATGSTRRGEQGVTRSGADTV